MFSRAQLKKEIFNINETSFEKFTLEVFKFQWEQNEVYQTYCISLNKNPGNIKTLKDIPFLPIEFYKNHEIKTGRWDTQKKFLSSGTTTSIRSTQHVLDEEFYHQVCKRIFESHFGLLHCFEIYALLPSYQQQGSSSLVNMVDFFIKQAAFGDFYQSDSDFLIRQLKKDSSRKKLLIGVSYALMDLAEKYPQNLDSVVIMETGGMKGRKKELTRIELHTILKTAFGPKKIHSEYGMTELNSQAYAKDGKFSFPGWARVIIRDIYDPFHFLGPNKIGGINIIDLANIDTCAFIETQDLGKIDESGVFEVLGRYDHSDIRGCNLII